jgi:hypothetical protein
MVSILVRFASAIPRFSFPTISAILFLGAKEERGIDSL